MEIFVATGTQKFQFNRLLVALDEVAKNHPDYYIFAQTGKSDYVPQHYTYEHFIDAQTFAQHIDNADLVITHGGAGVIVESVKKGKRVLAIPRLAQYGEHVDDHQLQITEAFRDAGYIIMCQNMNLLENAIKKALLFEPKMFVSNNAHFIESLEDVIARM